MSREKISRPFPVFPVRRCVSVCSYFWIYILVLEKVVKASVSLVTTGKDEYKITGEKIVGWGGIMVCQCPTGIYCPFSTLSGTRRQGKTVYLYFTFQQPGSSKCFTYFLVHVHSLQNVLHAGN